MWCVRCVYPICCVPCAVCRVPQVQRHSLRFQGDVSPCLGGGQVCLHLGGRVRPAPNQHIAAITQPAHHSHHPSHPAPNHHTRCELREGGGDVCYASIGRSYVCTLFHLRYDVHATGDSRGLEHAPLCTGVAATVSAMLYHASAPLSTAADACAARTKEGAEEGGGEVWPGEPREETRLLIAAATDRLAGILWE